MPQALYAKFDITAETEVIAATGGQKIYIVGISMHNNDVDSGDDTKVRLRDDSNGNSGADLYGGADGSIYLPGRGGVWGMPMSYDDPYWELPTNKPLYITPVAGKRVSGVVWYFKA